MVSRQSLLSHAIVRSHGAAPAWRQEELAALARQYSVSREVVLRRLFIAGHTSKIFYEKTHAQLRREYEKRAKKEGFVTPSTDAVSTAGKTFVRLVLGAYHDDRLTTSDVSDFLGVKLKHLDKVSELVGMG